MDKLHEFAREGRSVLIHTPQTPRAWMNHLWNEEGYLSSVSQVGAGESRYVTAENELNQIIEGETKHVYLRDDDSGVCWSPTYGP
ncbi:MAG: GH36-type glycosyl hydrolase domain-containing protein, partial [Planctomycetota bacterium]